MFTCCTASAVGVGLCFSPTPVALVPASILGTLWAPCTLLTDLNAKTVWPEKVMRRYISLAFDRLASPPPSPVPLGR